MPCANISAVLLRTKEAVCRYLQTDSFSANSSQHTAVSAIYQQHFGGEPELRAVFRVTGTFLPPQSFPYSFSLMGFFRLSFISLPVFFVFQFFFTFHSRFLYPLFSTVSLFPLGLFTCSLFHRGFFFHVFFYLPSYFPRLIFPYTSFNWNIPLHLWFDTVLTTLTNCNEILLRKKQGIL